MTFLLDTCVISELVARQPDPAVVQWVDSVDEDKLFLSAITIGEIKRGIEKLANSTRKSALQEWLEDDLLVRFRDKILPVDTAVMLVWGQLAADLEQSHLAGQAVDQTPRLIGAGDVEGDNQPVARVHRCTSASQEPGSPG